MQENDNENVTIEVEKKDIETEVSEPAKEPRFKEPVYKEYSVEELNRRAMEKRAIKAKKDKSSDEPSEESDEKSSVNASPYVTKKFLIICLAIAIIVSTILGASIAMMFGSSSSNKKHSNLSESSLDKATGSKLTIAQIVEKNEDSVVEIVVSQKTMNFFGQQELSEGAGSGVIVNGDGYIVTNYHVIEGADSVKVTLHNGDSYSATIVGGDDDNDLAVIKVNAKNLTVATVGDSSQVDVGDLAVAIGNPLGQLGGTATSGIISALDRRLTIDGRTLSLMQTDAAINPGNSGGGLFNGAGELIGIVDAKTSATGVEGLAFAIPINTVKDEIDSLIKDGKVSGKPAIGVTIYEVSEDNAVFYNLDGAGVYISEVTGDNAKKAGFKSGDKVLSINGKDIESSSDFVSRVRENKVGDTVTVDVVRDGQRIAIKTILEELIVTEN